MAPRSLFALIIKIIGIYLVIGGIVAIPQMLTAFHSFTSQVSYADSKDVFAIALFLIITVAIYISTSSRLVVNFIERKRRGASTINEI